MRIFSLLYCGVFIGIVVCLNLSIYIYISVIFILYAVFHDIFILCMPCMLCGRRNIFCIYRFEWKKYI